MKKKQLLELLQSTQAALEAMEAKYAASLVIDYGPPLSQWLDTHERQIRERGYKPQTIGNRTVLLGHIRRIWGHRPIRSIKAHEIISEVRSQFVAHGFTSTARRVLGEMRDVYAEAIANGLAENNPAAHCKMPKHKVMRHRLKFEVWSLMLKQAQSMRMPSWVPAMLLLALVIGQRRADIGAVRFDDVVTAEDGKQVLRIEQQKLAGKDHGARVEIPLDLRMDAIEMSVGDVIEYCRGCGKPGRTMIRKAGGGKLELSSLTARFHELIVLVEGPDAYKARTWPSLHEIRSLSARTYVFDQRLPPRVVQTLLGHSDLEMTELYMNARDLASGDWKRVDITPEGTPSVPEASSMGRSAWKEGPNN